MSRLTKKMVDGLTLPVGTADSIFWDSELRGLGVRVFASGAKKFVLQYRTRQGQQRRMSLGAYGPVTVERARELAQKHLGQVAEGHDPAGDRKARREALSVAQLCDRYLAAADQGLLVGRRGTPKKASTIYTDRGRIERHIKPLLGKRKADELGMPDIEAFKNAVATGKTATDVKTGRFGRAIVTGGKGTATRTLGLLGAILQWGVAQGHLKDNPVRGVRRFADNQRKALLSSEQYSLLGEAIRSLEGRVARNGARLHHPYGLACLRFIALTGLRRGEAENLRWSDVDFRRRCIVLGDTKTGESIRPLSQAATNLLDSVERIGAFIFPSGPGASPYRGLPKLWNVVRKTIRENGHRDDFDQISIHSLRHSYAGVAEDCGASLPSIAALLGHRLGGVTAGYVLKRIDAPLIALADQVSGTVAAMMSAAIPNENVLTFPVSA